MNMLKLFKWRKRPAKPQKDKTKRCEIIISGSGGQGMILAGKILAEAASMHDNKEAVMAQSYGPEARGGASRAEIIISSDKINYPRVTQADAMLAMTQEALDKYKGALSPRGLLVVDSTFVRKIPTHLKNVFKADFSLLAIKILDERIVANIIALGALAAITKVVSREALIHAVLERVPKRVLVIDRVAVDTGFKAVEDAGHKLGIG